MTLDIRWPIGLLFSIVGLMLSLYGIFTRASTELYERSLGININFWWGTILVVFGVCMLIPAWRDSKKKT